MADIKVVRPMLADSRDYSSLWEDSKYWAEVKIDGSRYICHIGRDGNRFTSRQISKKTGLPVEKTENVPHLAYEDWSPFEGTILDGEMQHHDFSKTISIMGSLPQKSVELQKSIGFITYNVFDILEFKGEDVRSKPYWERREILEEVVRGIYDLTEIPNFHLVMTVTEKENKRKFYDDIVQSGGEGVILKHIDGVYVEDERSKYWVKVKKYITDDVVIVGSEAPTRYYSGNALKSGTWRYWESSVVDYNYLEEEMTVEQAKKLNYRPVTRAWFKGWIGAIRFGKYIDGKLVELGQTSGIEDNMKEILSDDFCEIRKEYIGTVIEIGAMEIIKKSLAYRHPRFLRLRPDKCAEDCRC